LHGSRGLSVLIVEQNREFLAALSRRILFLQKKKIMRQLVPSNLLNAELIDEFAS
jgi:branched-chain amino acid transport system ATP-binding protein